MGIINFIGQNIGTIAVGAAVILIVGLLILKLIKDKKSGKGGCSCGCSSCPMSKSCPSASSKGENK